MSDDQPPGAEPNTVKGDNDAVVAFYEKYACSTATMPSFRQSPDKEAIQAYTFKPGDKAGLLKVLERVNGVENCYFQVNPLKKPLTGAAKANKQDVAAVHWLQADMDPNPLREIDKEQARILMALEEFDPKPNIIIFSGGGYQGFWALEEPIQMLPREDGTEPWAEPESLSKQIALILSADPCFNVDRIMRVPGTVNMPNKKKRAKGRKPALAKVVHWDDGSYRLSRFPRTPVASVRTSSAPQRNGGVPNVKISTEDLRRYTLEEIKRIATSRGQALSDDTMMLIVQGDDPDKPDRFESRSEAVFKVVIELERAKFEPHEIAAICTDADYAISAHINEQKRPAKYMQRQIERARDALIDPDLEEMNEKHAVVIDSNRVFVTYGKYDELSKKFVLGTMHTEDFKKMYENKKHQFSDQDGKIKSLPIADWWLRKAERRFYSGMAYAPAGADPSILNLWEGFSVEPRPGKWDRIRELISDVIADGDEADAAYIFNWAAFSVQHLGEIPKVAITLRGERGVGEKYVRQYVHRSFWAAWLIRSNNKSCGEPLQWSPSQPVLSVHRRDELER